MSECAKWRCSADSLPHTSFCYEHIPRYEIPHKDDLECAECGQSGSFGTIHDDLYYCQNYNYFFDPRRTEYLERLREQQRMC